VTVPRDNNNHESCDPEQTVFGVDSRPTISIDENLKLKAELEALLSQLEGLRDEVEKGRQSTLNDPAKDSPDREGTGDVWTLIGDVCDKYQVPLASLI